MPQETPDALEGTREGTAERSEPGAGPTQPALATLAVTAGRPAPGPDAPLNPQIVLTSTYHAGGPVGYGRHGNPTWSALESAVAALEHGSALAFASGMAAIAAVLETVPVGAVVLAPTHAYSGTRALLGELAGSGRIRLREVDVSDPDALAGAVPGVELVWLESPTNPMLTVVDLPRAIAHAHRAGARVAVDNTFATPMVQRPLELGADLVVHSATKYLSGHSDAVLGVTVAARPEQTERLAGIRALRGAVPGPVESWLVLRGLRTLHLRVAAASANAAELAGRLSGHPAVTRVRYPGLPGDPGHARAAAQMSGFGAIVAFEVSGGAAAADRVCAGTRLWVAATSLGGVESTLERRRRWAAESPEVPEGLIRLSVGVEDVEDLWADLDGALRATS